MIACSTGAHLSRWESDCHSLPAFYNLIVLFLCVMFWRQKDARDSLQCVNVMLVKSLLQRSYEGLLIVVYISRLFKDFHDAAVCLKRSRCRMSRGVRGVNFYVSVQPHLFRNGCVI